MSNEREYRVWHENGDLIDVFASPTAAEGTAIQRRTGCDCGEDPGPEGLFCGTLHPHGIFVQACEGDQDVTQDYLINGN